MSPILLEILFLFLLIAANGVFAMSELAVVSARKSRLRQWAESGDRSARTALELSSDPNRFLSTVQVGITLVGTLAGVFGGATLAEDIADRLERFPSLAPYGETIGLAVVVAGIAYFSLIFGELVPKRIAMSHPESIACLVATPLRMLSVVGVPIVRLLGGSTELVLRFFRVRRSAESSVTEEEVKAMVKEGARAGVFEEAEHEMVKRVFRLGDKRAAALMTPRPDVVWLDVADPPEVIQRKITESPHSRFPVCEGALDTVLGIVHVKDLLVHGFIGQPLDFRGLLTMPLFIYEATPGLKVLEMFKSSGTHIAIVLDEYGLVEGLLTLNDILEAIVGDMPDEADASDRRAVKRPDGSWLLDGMLSVDEFRDIFEPVHLPEGDYETLAGFIITRLGRIPEVADRFEWGGITFEVVDMDGNRVDKVLVAPVQSPES
jgi:putative hemolysin